MDGLCWGEEKDQGESHSALVALLSPSQGGVQSADETRILESWVPATVPCLGITRPNIDGRMRLSCTTQAIQNVIVSWPCITLRSGKLCVGCLESLPNAQTTAEARGYQVDPPK